MLSCSCCISQDQSLRNIYSGKLHFGLGQLNADLYSSNLAMAKLSSYATHAPGWTVWLLLAGYGVSILAGGAAGAVAGVLLMRWMRGSTRKSLLLEEAAIPSIRQPFGRDW